MLNDFTGADKVYIACGYTDLRKGIDVTVKCRGGLKVTRENERIPPYRT